MLLTATLPGFDSTNVCETMSPMRTPPKFVVAGATASRPCRPVHVRLTTRLGVVNASLATVNDEAGRAPCDDGAHLMSQLAVPFGAIGVVCKPVRPFVTV